MIPVEKLRMTQPLVRTQVWYTLYTDMKEKGQQKPLLVKRVHDDFYDVVDGNKRLAVAFALGWTEMSCELVH